MMSTRAFLCTSLLVLGACSSNTTPDASSDGAVDSNRNDTINVSEAGDTATDRPAPTDTPMPTDTPTPTDTPVPTDTPTPMDVIDTDVPVPVDVPIVVDADDVPAPMDVPTDVAPGCGNGIIEAAEQCDDGNLYNLDGCDSMCRYEPIIRMTSAAISSSMSPASCTPRTNALGTVVFTTAALDQLNMTLQGNIDAGDLNVLVQALGLTDLTGTTGSGISLGVMDGVLDPAHPGTWPATGNPIDWWFLVDPTTVSGGLPVGLITSGAIAMHNLTAGPSTVNVPLSLGGSAALLTMNSARINAVINATPAPNTPAPPPTVASGVSVFQTVSANGTGQGLCGNITVQSLAAIPVPMALTSGAGACNAVTGSHAYVYCGSGMPVGPACNSLLDVIVGGCRALGGLLRVSTATQPDVAGSGTVRMLTLATGTNKVPASQITGNTDAYSAFLTFTANRTHATGQQCAVTSDCQSGQTCMGAAAPMLGTCR